MGPTVFAGNALYGGHQFTARQRRSREWLAHKEPTSNKWLRQAFSQAYELELSVAGDKRSQSIALLGSPYKCLFGIASMAPLIELLVTTDVSP
jgi:hypothetical protein